MTSTCPCCGYQTLVAPSPSWDTCPVCWWTDDDTSTPARADALLRAQDSFARDGVSDPAWRSQVRAPAADEARDPRWRPHVGPSPRSLLRTELQAALHAVFADTAPGQRLGLCTTYQHDFNAAPEIDWNDRDSHWTEIPAPVLDYFSDGGTVFSFGNVDDFRYYMPAFMSRSLERDEPLAATSALATSGHPERIAAFDDAQRAVVVAFLRYATMYFPHAAWAATALRRWEAAARGNGGLT